MLKSPEDSSRRAGDCLRIACNGYVEADAGSVASAGFVVLEELLKRDYQVDFFSKRSFTYPRALLERYPNLKFIDTTNDVTNAIHEKIGVKTGIIGSTLTGQLNHRAYSKTVLNCMRQMHRKQPYDIGLFLGLAAFGNVDSLPMVSWLQGAPGSDVRSLKDRAMLLRQTESKWRYLCLRAFGIYKMSFGLPRYTASNVLVVGSKVSQKLIQEQYANASQKVLAIPYPIDLDAFRAGATITETAARLATPLRLLWLGRIVPRKRLDLLMRGCEIALEKGVDLSLHIVGNLGFAPGLKQLITKCSFSDRMSHVTTVPRQEVPKLLSQHDILVQPSDEENFGSSVAEAMACGMPSIVGATNGTGDYIDEVSVRLADDRPETLAIVLANFASLKASGKLSKSRSQIRAKAEQEFAVENVANSLESILRETANRDKMTCKPRNFESK